MFFEWVCSKGLNYVINSDHINTIISNYDCGNEDRLFFIIVKMKSKQANIKVVYSKREERDSDLTHLEKLVDLGVRARRKETEVQNSNDLVYFDTDLKERKKE